MYTTSFNLVIFMSCLIIVRHSGKIMKLNLFFLYDVVSNESLDLYFQGRERDCGIERK
jgi:hypothetical protein